MFLSQTILEIYRFLKNIIVTVGKKSQPQIRRKRYTIIRYTYVFATYTEQRRNVLLYTTVLSVTRKAETKKSWLFAIHFFNYVELMNKTVKWFGKNSLGGYKSGILDLKKISM